MEKEVSVECLISESDIAVDPDHMLIEVLDLDLDGLT